MTDENYRRRAMTVLLLLADVYVRREREKHPAVAAAMTVAHQPTPETVDSAYNARTSPLESSEQCVA